jgi:hypothetical protein
MDKNIILNFRSAFVYLFIFFYGNNYTQTSLKKDSAKILNKDKMDTNWLASSSLIGKYQLPQSDFIVFNLENDNEKLYTGKINLAQLQHDAGFALCCMGRIPPVGVTYFNKGYSTGFVQVGSAAFASEIKEVKQKTIALHNLSEYEDKRAALLEKKNVYILDEATISYNKYFNIGFSNIDLPNEGRFYTQLSDMKFKKFKGVKADFYFHGFETLPDFFDANGNNIYNLKLYYWDFPNDISTEDILNHETCKAIFGRDYLLKTEWRNNYEYVITWYEY